MQSHKRTEIFHVIYVSIEECCLKYKTERVLTPARRIRQLVQMKQDLSDDVHASMISSTTTSIFKYTCYVNTLKYYDIRVII